MEILAIFLIMAAFRGLVKQTRQDLAAWRKRPPKPKGSHWWDRPITGPDVGYWGHQLLHGFPTARHGLHDGWSRAQQAHHRARRGIAQARAEHAEGKAELHPELEEYRERRRKALEDLWEQQRWQPEEAADPTALPAQPAADLEPEDDPVSGNWERDPGKDDQCAICGTPLTGERGHVCTHCQQGNQDDDPARRCPFCLSGIPATGPLPPEHVNGACMKAGKPDEDPAAGWDDPLPGEEQDTPEPDQAPGTDNAKGDETVTETSYKAVKARMVAAQAAAEQRQAEAKAAVTGTEERVAEAQAHATYAETTGDEMQALNVDADTLNAMAEHQDALRETVEAEQALEEAATRVNTTWQNVVETAGTVSQQLEASGHGNLDQAHDDAAGGGAERAFYGQG